MAEQTFSLGSPASFSGSEIRWAVRRIPRVLIDRSLRASSVSRWLGSLDLFSAGSAVLGIIREPGGSDIHGADLSELFETSGSITITVNGANSVTLFMGDDASSPYDFNSAKNTARASSWFAGLPDTITSASLTLRDFVQAAAVPLTGRLSAAVSVSAALSKRTIAPVVVAARLSVALSVSAVAPRATAASVVLNAEQFIDLGPPNRFTERAIGWDSISFRIDDSLAPRSRWLRGMVIFGRTGAANLNFEADATQVSQFRADLLERFETNGSITITANGSSVTLAVVDSADPYFFGGADNQALGKAWFGALVGPITSASLTLRDFVPVVVIVVPLAGRLAAALTVSATAPVAVAPDAVPLTGRLATALSVVATAPVAVGAAAVPLAGRLATALTVAATAPGRVAPTAVSLTGRLATALSVAATAPGRVARNGGFAGRSADRRPDGGGQFACRRIAAGPDRQR